MNRHTIDLEFADGEYTFALPLPRINELQAKCSIGIGGLFARLVRGCVQVGEEVYVDPGQAQFYVVDIVETIRQGLIGGAKGIVNGNEIVVTNAIAERLIQNYVLDRPLKDSWSIAVSVLGACVVGYDPPKKDSPGDDRATETTDTSTTT